MNSLTLSDKTLADFDRPIISCPFCHSGSSQLSYKAFKCGIWGYIDCECGKRFEVAHAIDEMFAQGSESGYVLWANSKVLTKQVQCNTGRSAIVDIRGIFEEVYRIIPGFVGGAEFLAGGISTHYIQQGYAMVALAPFPNGECKTLNIILRIVGREKGKPTLEEWRNMLLNARLSIFKAPHLTIIMAVSAVDLYLESLLRNEVHTGRPGSWSNHVKQITGKKLSELLTSDFQRIEKFVHVRNALAHGRDHISKLPSALIALERRWEETGHLYSGEGAVAPSAIFALRVSTEIIRCCRRQLRSSEYEPIPNFTV